ncbi:MAG: hypothetical protein MUO39_06885 [Steroidobacteraceae bacterium]|nr:hypothetical protein [Steroidobacteraceae bacterium]
MHDSQSTVDACSKGITLEEMVLQSDPGGMLERKLQWLFPSDADREQARESLAELISGVEGKRVALAAFKLAGSDLGELRRCVDAARIDYRDILAWAEYPRQMRLGASAPAAEQEAARREDAAEYQRWLGVN